MVKDLKAASGMYLASPEPTKLPHGFSWAILAIMSSQEKKNTLPTPNPIKKSQDVSKISGVRRSVLLQSKHEVYV
jgi:hypothetical protein